MSGPDAHLLIVDDDEAVRRAHRRLLVGSGFEVSEACSGPEALEMVSNGHRPAVVVLDYSMPGMLGDEVLREIRAAIPDLPVEIDPYRVLEVVNFKPSQ